MILLALPQGSPVPVSEAWICHLNHQLAGLIRSGVGFSVASKSLSFLSLLSACSKIIGCCPLPVRVTTQDYYTFSRESL